MEIYVDNRAYTIQLYRRVTQPVTAPRLVVVSYQPNPLAQQILRVCIQVIQHLTPEPHELWVVDNNSPLKHIDWLLKSDNINVVLNRTEPLPPQARTMLGRLMGLSKHKRNQQGRGSYANAIALEMAARLIEPQSRYLMTLHMDTMPCHVKWLPFLLSKLQGNIAAVGVRLDKARTPEGILHVLGYMVDFQVFQRLQLNFLPQLPKYDVGDRVTVALREAGYDVWACPNTLWEPELVNKIPASSPLRHLHVDRSFDDEGNVIFLHLGRGIAKSVSGHVPTGRTSPEQWIRFAREMLHASSVTSVTGSTKFETNR